MRAALVRFNFAAFLFTSFVLADFDLDAIAYEEELRDDTRALNEQEDGDETRDNLLKDEGDDLDSQSESEEPANKRVRNA